MTTEQNTFDQKFVKKHVVALFLFYLRKGLKYAENFMRPFAEVSTRGVL